MSHVTVTRRAFALCAATLVCLLGLAGAAHSQNRNLLGNPGFEDALGDHAWMPAAWDTSRGNTEMVFFGRDAFSARTGKFGLSVANASVTAPLWHNWSQTLYVTPDMWGKDLVFTVWSKSNGIDGRGYNSVQACRDTVGKMSLFWKIRSAVAANGLSVANVGPATPNSLSAKPSVLFF